MISSEASYLEAGKSYISQNSTVKRNDYKLSSLINIGSLVNKGSIDVVSELQKTNAAMLELADKAKRAKKSLQNMEKVKRSPKNNSTSPSLKNTVYFVMCQDNFENNWWKFYTE